MTPTLSQWMILRDIAREKMELTQQKLRALVPAPDSDVPAYQPDGKVISIDSQTQIVHLNLGSNDRVYRGLTFSIYDKNMPIPKDGKGKAEMLGERVKRFKADVVIFDNDLSPGQIRELEKVIESKVVDRSELILDIFATRAKTKQAKLQVELAQLEYLMPRLTRLWTHLSKLGGGIGTRGPGEKQLEVDKRQIQATNF